MSVEVLAMELGERGSRKGFSVTFSGKEWVVDVLVNTRGFGTYGFVLRSGQGLPARHDPGQYGLIDPPHGIVASGNAGERSRQNTERRIPGSVASLSPVMAVYFATEAYVPSFSQALAEEC